MWKVLDEEKKKKYIDDAREELTKFKEQYGDAAFKHAPKTLKKKQAVIKKKKGAIEEYEFLNQLVSMVNDLSISQFISWSVPTTNDSDGGGIENIGKIVVLDPQGLQDNVLGEHFKHSQYASFQRQMNYFGFKKKMHKNKGKFNPCSYVHEGLGKEPSSILTLRRRQKGKKESAASDDAVAASESSGEKKRKEPSTSAEDESHKKRRRKCNVSDCTNQAKSGGICIKHGAKQPERKNRKVCAKEECDNIAQKAGVCRAHADRCSKDGCDNRAKKGDTCLKHVSATKNKKRHRAEEGAHDHSHDLGEEKQPAKARKKKATDTAKTKVCNAEGCEKKPVRKGACNDHGGKQNCEAQGCDNVAKAAGVCRKHGAKAKTCSNEGCDNVVRQGGKCVRHGARVTASMLCSVEDCSSRAQKGGICRKHGTYLDMRREIFFICHYLIRIN